MSAFSPLDAAFEGFRFTREQPRSILLWAALVFVVGLVGAALMIATGAQAAVEAFNAAWKAKPMNVEGAVGALPRLLPGASIQLTISFLMFAVLSCSALRALLGPERRPSIHFGGQEVRMLVLTLAISLFGLFASLPVAVLSGALSAMAGGPASPVGALLFAAGQAVGLIIQAVILVRLALAAPMIIAEGKFSLAESWRRTRGRFWPLVLALVISFALFAVVAMLASTVLRGLLTLAGAALHVPPPASGAGVSALLHPMVLVFQLGAALIFALGVPILAGPLAAAYRALR